MFRFLLEVIPQPDCEDLDPAEVAGAAVNALVSAANRPAAEAAVRADLAERRMTVAVVEGAWEYDAPDGRGECGDDLAEAARRGGVIYDAFHCWPHDAADA